MRISTQKYIHREVSHLRRSTKIQSKLNKLALKRAERVMDHRLEGMNEFRDQLNRQAGTFVTKEQLDLIIANIMSKVNANSKILYIGIGIVLVLQVFSVILIKFIQR
jgi:hypothetical protein